jgi:hypothetical protein
MTGTWDDINPQLVAIKNVLDGKDAAYTTVVANLAAASTQISGLVAQLNDAQLQLGAALARIKELEGQTTPPPTTTTKTLFGTGGGNSDRTAEKLSLDRRYYNSTQTDSCIGATKKNATAKIITWNSFKVPSNDWAGAAAGKYDAWFKDLIAKLVSLDYETWLAVHHEPEGDGDLNQWKAMQAHYASLVPKASKIKYWLVVVGYSQEYTDTTWWDKYYPTGAPIHGIAYDNPYLKYGVPLDGTKLVTTWSEGKASYIDKLVARAKKLGVSAGIGEMGYSNEAFTKDKAWLQRALQAAVDGKVEGVCYFDSNLNSTRSWSLGTGTTKRIYFDTVVADLR